MSQSATLLDLSPAMTPAAPTWWPLAWGWWALIAAAVLLAILITNYVKIKRRRNAAKNVALNKLTCAESAESAQAILRQAVLSYYPREHVASLTDTAWFEFLDSQVTSPLFMPKQTLWQQALYQQTSYQQGTSEELPQLVCDCQLWLKQALPPKGVTHG